MIASAVRTLGAVVAALVLALVLVVAVEIFSAVVHPTPPGFQGTQKEMCLHVARYPQWILAAVVPMWGLIALASTWVAGRLGNRGSAIFVGLLLLAAALCNTSMLPYVAWFKIVMPLVIALAVVCGFLLSKPRKPADDWAERAEASVTS